MISQLTGRPGPVGTLFVAALGVCLGFSGTSADALQGKGRPKAALRVNPTLIFVPQRVVATAELTEGTDDYQEYYCPKIEWIWGDDTHAESAEDCDPYEPGKSQIRRRYTADHTYKEPGNYDIVFRMKQGSKTVLSLRQNIRAQGH